VPLWICGATLDRFQLILDSAAQAVSKTPRISYISPILESLYWLKIDPCTVQSSLSPKKALQCQKPSYLYNILNLQVNTYSFIYCFHSSASTINSRFKIPIDRSLTMLLLSETVVLKSFATLYVTRHLPIYHALLITFSLSPHLSFTPIARLISSNNHSRHSLIAPLHRRFSGSFDLA